MKNLKHLKRFDESIELPSYHKESANQYLDELGISLDDLNDIFSDLVDSNFKSYLQVFYFDEGDGKRWISMDRISTGRVIHPYLDISFSKDLVLGDKAEFGSTYYLDETETTKAFLSGVDRLKSMFPNKEILWTWSRPADYLVGHVCIYFDKIITGS